MASQMTVTAAQIAALISRTTFRYRNELQLHDGIVLLLESHGVTGLKREVRLSPADRIDFLAGSLGIEVKVDGPHRQVWRQMHRYATHDSISELLLITSRAHHVARAPLELDGKRVHIAVLGRRF